MTYRVVISGAAEKDLRRIRDRTALRRLFSAIEALADDPRPSHAGKLRGMDNIWRIRVGDWRICYSIEIDRLIVLVLTIARRGDVYERLRRRLD
ncbi:MAG: type II toxin-antitoxin system RelE/ParE family toxin [Thiotrichales bacterium]|nr:type II toxin-antitoxin system RelE/ParE family toxin [Thiotrichales bacterium]MCY4284052.1 type II toxin-antitoxin system RelE/ParE family toxin [Thiotrichales bacterium]MCY4350791.1 type II toxin-antitoxin system RelE/ParE family toxin [Thiotrichales bacterium]